MASLKLSDDDLLSSLSDGTDVGSQSWLLLKYPDRMRHMGHEEIQLLLGLIKKVGNDFIISMEWRCDNWTRCYYALVKEHASDSVAQGGDISYFDIGNGRPAWVVVEKAVGCVWDYLTGESMSVLCQSGRELHLSDPLQGGGQAPLRICPRWDTVCPAENAVEDGETEGPKLCSFKELAPLFNFLDRKRRVNWHECLASMELYLSLNAPGRYDMARPHFESMEGEYLRRSPS